VSILRYNMELMGERKLGLHDIICFRDSQIPCRLVQPLPICGTRSMTVLNKRLCLLASRARVRKLIMQVLSNLLSCGA